MGKNKKRRVVLITGLAVLLLLAATAFLLPYILKRYIEKHSVEWINRRITIDNIILNPFTFTYAVNGVKCFEPGSDEVFVAWSSISVKSNLWNGFRERHWRFRRLRIEEPYFHIVQHGARFNFSDLVEPGSAEGPSTPDSSAPVLFSMEDIQLADGRVLYASNLMKAPVGISGLRANCTRITSENARMDFSLHFIIDAGGEVDGRFKIDTERNLYAVHGQLRSFALTPLLPYLQDFMHTTALKGSLDLGLHLEDSWTDTAALAASGSLALQGLEIADGAGDHLIGLQQGRIELDTLNARDRLFHISRVGMNGFSTRYRQWADGSNTWTKALKSDSTATTDSTVLIAADPANIFVMLAGYIQMLGQEFVANQYTADSLVVANGTVQFEDFTPEKPFRYTLDQLNVRSSRITSAAGTADFTASARLNQRGMVTSTFKFDPGNFRNVEASMQVKDLALPDFDAYSRWYGAYPIRSGVLDYSGTTSIRNGMIDSRNQLTADDLRFAKKTSIHDTGIYILPLRLAASLLRDVHGKIHLDIPVKGNLNDPEFKPWPIVWQVLKNLVVKAAAAPVKLVAGMFGAKDEADMDEVRFAPNATAVGKDQRRVLDALAALLKEKPELQAALVPVGDVRREMEEWAARRMKMEHLGLQLPLSKADSMRVAELSLRDSSFTAFLNARSPGTLGKPEAERCVAAAGPAMVRQHVEELDQARRGAVATYLGQAGVTNGRANFRPGTPEELAGHAGDPGFRFMIEVKD